jgi:hypothetical protein
LFIRQLFIICVHGVWKWEGTLSVWLSRGHELKNKEESFSEEHLLLIFWQEDSHLKATYPTAQGFPFDLERAFEDLGKRNLLLSVQRKTQVSSHSNAERDEGLENWVEVDCPSVLASFPFISSPKHHHPNPAQEECQLLFIFIRKSVLTTTAYQQGAVQWGVRELTWHPESHEMGQEAVMIPQVQPWNIFQLQILILLSWKRTGQDLDSKAAGTAIASVLGAGIASAGAATLNARTKATRFLSANMFGGWEVYFGMIIWKSKNLWLAESSSFCTLHDRHDFRQILK